MINLKDFRSFRVNEQLQEVWKCINDRKVFTDGTLKTFDAKTAKFLLSKYSKLIQVIQTEDTEYEREKKQKGASARVSSSPPLSISLLSRQYRLKNVKRKNSVGSALVNAPFLFFPAQPLSFSFPTMSSTFPSYLYVHASIQENTLGPNLQYRLIEHILGDTVCRSIKQRIERVKQFSSSQIYTSKHHGTASSSNGHCFDSKDDAKKHSSSSSSSDSSSLSSIHAELTATILSPSYVDVVDANPLILLTHTQLSQIRDRMRSCVPFTNTPCPTHIHRLLFRYPVHPLSGTVSEHGYDDLFHPLVSEGGSTPSSSMSRHSGSAESVHTPTTVFFSMTMCLRRHVICHSVRRRVFGGSASQYGVGPIVVDASEGIRQHHIHHDVKGKRVHAKESHSHDPLCIYCEAERDDHKRRRRERHDIMQASSLSTRRDEARFDVDKVFKKDVWRHDADGDYTDDDDTHRDTHRD
ncbi:hypothetical protein ADUPG1_011463, partial [Aduncisulcus paluster]